MGARTRELESALADLQAQVSDKPHPLLSALDSPPEPGEANAPNSPGMLSVDIHGYSRFYGYGGALEVRTQCATLRLRAKLRNLLRNRAYCQ